MGFMVRFWNYIYILLHKHILVFWSLDFYCCQKRRCEGKQATAATSSTSPAPHLSFRLEFQVGTFDGLSLKSVVSHFLLTYRGQSTSRAPKCNYFKMFKAKNDGDRLWLQPQQQQWYRFDASVWLSMCDINNRQQQHASTRGEKHSQLLPWVHIWVSWFSPNDIYLSVIPLIWP